MPILQFILKQGGGEGTAAAVVVRRATAKVRNEKNL
jgi:hypothetical protein